MNPPRPRFIIKADDYGRGPLLDPWRRFMDVCLNLDAVPSIGVVGADLAANPRARAMARLYAETFGVEFWNHSWNHRNLIPMSPDERDSDTLSCHRLLEEVIGAKPIAYGAPFNATNVEIARDIVRVGGYRLLYDFANGASGAIEVPRGNYVSAEIMTQIYRPIRFHMFRSRFDKMARTELPRLVLLQVHPHYWANECFKEFEFVLRYLIERSYTAMTAADHADAEDAAAGRPIAMATPGAMVPVFETIAANLKLGDRLQQPPPPTALARYLQRFALLDPRGDSGSLMVAEIGDNAGLWAIAAASATPRIHAIGISADPGSAICVENLLRESKSSASYEYKVGAVTAMPLASGSIDFLIFNGELQTGIATAGLCEFARVLETGGRLLLGLDTEVTLVRSVFDGVREHRRDTSLAALDKVFRLAGRRAGVLADANLPAWWSDHELITVAKFCGFEPVVRSASGPMGDSWLGIPLRSHSLVMHYHSSRRRGEAMRAGTAVTAAQVQALISAGVGASLLEWMTDWPASMTTEVSGLALAVQAHHAGGVALKVWQERIASGHSGWNVDLAELARQLACGEWSVALRHADAIGVKLPPQGLLALGWCSGRATGIWLEESQAVPPLLNRLWALGSAVAVGDWSQADNLADILLRNPTTQEHLLAALSGESPGVGFGFTAAVN